MEYKHTSVRLPVTVAAELESLARKRGIQVSVLLREVVERGLKHTGVLDEAVLAKETRKLLAVTMRKVSAEGMEPVVDSLSRYVTRLELCANDLSLSQSTLDGSLESAISRLGKAEAKLRTHLQEVAGKQVEAVGAAAVAKVKAVCEPRTWKQKAKEFLMPALVGAVAMLTVMMWFPVGPPRISEAQEEDLRVGARFKERLSSVDEATKRQLMEYFNLSPRQPTVQPRPEPTP